MFLFKSPRSVSRKPRNFLDKDAKSAPSVNAEFLNHLNAIQAKFIRDRLALRFLPTSEAIKKQKIEEIILRGILKTSDGFSKIIQLLMLNPRISITENLKYVIAFLADQEPEKNEALYTEIFAMADSPDEAKRALFPQALEAFLAYFQEAKPQENSITMEYINKMLESVKAADQQNALVAIKVILESESVSLKQQLMTLIEQCKTKLLDRAGTSIEKRRLMLEVLKTYVMALLNKPSAIKQLAEIKDYFFKAFNEEIELDIQQNILVTFFQCFGNSISDLELKKWLPKSWQVVNQLYTADKISQEAMISFALFSNLLKEDQFLTWCFIINYKADKDTMPLVFERMNADRKVWLYKQLAKNIEKKDPEANAMDLLLIMEKTLPKAGSAHLESTVKYIAKALWLLKNHSLSTNIRRKAADYLLIVQNILTAEQLTEFKKLLNSQPYQDKPWAVYILALTEMLSEKELDVLYDLTNEEDPFLILASLQSLTARYITYKDKQNLSEQLEKTLVTIIKQIFSLLEKNFSTASELLIIFDNLRNNISQANLDKVIKSLNLSSAKQNKRNSGNLAMLVANTSTIGTPELRTIGGEAITQMLPPAPLEAALQSGAKLLADTVNSYLPPAVAGIVSSSSGILAEALVERVPSLSDLRLNELTAMEKERTIQGLTALVLSGRMRESWIQENIAKIVNEFEKDEKDWPLAMYDLFVSSAPYLQTELLNKIVLLVIKRLQVDRKVYVINALIDMTVTAPAPLASAYPLIWATLLCELAEEHCDESCREFILSALGFIWLRLSPDKQITCWGMLENKYTDAMNANTLMTFIRTFVDAKAETSPSAISGPTTATGVALPS